MARKSDTVTGRWPVAVYDVDGKQVEPSAPATVSKGKAGEYDARFGRLAEVAEKPSMQSADPGVNSRSEVQRSENKCSGSAEGMSR